MTKISNPPLNDETIDYGVLGNLHLVTLPTGDQLDYVNDGYNRRVGRNLNGTSQWTRAFMGNRLEGEYAATGVLQKEYVHATNDLAADYMIAGGAEYRLIKDYLGSVRLVVNVSTGAIAERIDYNEWGKVLRDTNSCFEPFGFAGGVYDKDTGFVLFGARDYDPETGRWTSKDPILFKGGSPNLYSYVLNDPINFVDPSGKAASLSEFWNNTVDALNDLVRHLKDPPSGSRVKEVKKFCEGRMDDAFDTINNVTNDLGK